MPWSKCLPFRRPSKVKQMEFPFSSLGLFNMMTLQWMSRKLWNIYHFGYHVDELAWTSSNEENAHTNYERIKELRKKYPSSFTKVYLGFIFHLLIISLISNCISNLLEFVGSAIFIRLLMDYIKSDYSSKTYGMFLVFFVLILNIVKCFLRTLSIFLSILSGGRLKAGLMYTTYKKLLMVRGLQGKSSGQMVNLFANDLQRVFEVTMHLPSVLVVPIIFTASLLYCSAILGVWCLVGFVILFLLYLSQYILSRWHNYYRFQAIKATDKRVEKITELLFSIKVVKLYSWEDSIKDKIQNIRQQERHYLKKAALLQSVSISLIPIVSTLSLVVMFAGYIASGYELAVSDAFVIMSLYNLTKVRLVYLPYYIRLWSDSRVSLSRLESVFQMEEIDMIRSTGMKDPSNALEVENATFGWTKPSFYPEIKASFTTYSSESLDKYFEENLETKESLTTHYSFASNYLSQLNKSVQNNKNVDANLLDNNYYNTPHNNNINFNKNNINYNNININLNNNISLDNNLNFNNTNINNNNNINTNNEPSEYTETKTRRIYSNASGSKKSSKAFDVESYIEDTMKRKLCFEYLCCLFDIDLSIKKGKMLAVCGRVGSGKSSLLSSLICQTKLLAGKVRMQGTVGYLDQQAWIFTGSIRDNILFCKPFEVDRYNDVIARCCLTNDINKLVARDATKVGEGGMLLSGGEKQRIVLARILYSDVDVLLLDEPLSAVDGMMQKEIFENCLRMASKEGKTVLFNTHHLEYVSMCDEIIFLRNGRIYEMGNHKHMMLTNGDYASIVRNFYHLKGTKGSVTSLGEDFIPLEYEEQPKRFLFEDHGKTEEVFLSRKPIKWGTYKTYVKFYGGWRCVIITIILFFLPIIAAFITDYWLSLYLIHGAKQNLPKRLNETVQYGTETTPANQNVLSNFTLRIFLLVYISTGLSTVVFLSIRSAYFVVKTLKAASFMHDKILDKLMKAPLIFFYSNPLSKVVSCFTSGMDGIDIRLPLKLEDFFQHICTLLIAVVSVSIAFPYFIIFVLVLFLVIFALQRISRSITRQLKRSESVNKSPLYGHVLSTVTGLPSIQGFNRIKEYEQKFHDLIDKHISSTLTLHFYSKWLSLRLELLSIICSVLVSFLIVISKGTIHPSLAGLAIAYIIQLNSILQHSVKLSSDIEARFNSVEKISGLIANMPQESTAQEHSVPTDWPSRGKIVFKNFSFKYGENLPLVLKNISLKIRPSEKIGVVGRTASGKTSLISCLFRLVEKHKGNIYIDGIDISHVPLKELRSRLGIIPQDPVLFSGTVRFNLDPLQQYSDDQLWDALEKCKMKTTIMNFKYGLSSKITSGGPNFSMGQKQLLCLARCFVKQTKILILDEATDAVDLEMDLNIQSAINEILTGRTIITIAHRLKTVLQCDRLLYLEDGTIAAFDTPKNLLRSKKIFFT